MLDGAASQSRKSSYGIPNSPRRTQLEVENLKKAMAKRLTEINGEQNQQKILELNRLTVNREPHSPNIGRLKRLDECNSPRKSPNINLSKSPQQALKLASKSEKSKFKRRKNKENSSINGMPIIEEKEEG